MNTLIIIVDANIVLHFRRIDEIDWCALTNADHCELIVAPVLLRELEKIKIHSAKERLRKRASKGIDYFSQKMDHADPIELRSHCVLKFRSSEPLIDYSAHLLSRDVEDDHYIATAIELASEEGAEVAIASADSGMKLKLRTREFSLIDPGEEHRLPEEIDQAERELQEIRRENDRLKAAIPKPIVKFASGTVPHLFVVRPTMQPNILTPDEQRAKFPLEDEPPADRLGARITFMSSPQSRNRDLREYYEEYETFYEDYARWFKTLGRLDYLELALENEGRASATNIRVEIPAPTGARWVEISDNLGQPEEPKSPDEWPGAFELLGPTMPRFDDILHRDRDGDASVLDDGARVVFECALSNPKSDLNLEKVGLLLDDCDCVGRTISLIASVSFREAPPIECQLPIRFVETDHATE